ncbi:PAS domain-containing sensor histidine kinase [Rufibacter latericius]|uniref:histidine kinase n=1 Tax=Rufibacter latericius TaxID=2487040 RepID=A0A3M9N0V8_9BACT|nr:PAS domain-containing sensor histidine kinase [Rufibacter latericius]RNI31421.1 PAS domain S-box protein [Rufibacter latericius]
MKVSQIKSVKSRVEWARFAQASLDLFCTLDAEGYYSFTSEASTDLLGYESWELEGQHFTDLLHPEEKTSTQQALRAVYSGFKRRDLQTRLLHKNGTEVHVLWSAAWSEEDEAMFCIGRDITGLVVSSQRKGSCDQSPKTVSLAKTAIHPSGSLVTQEEAPASVEAPCQEVKMELSELTKDLTRKNSDLQQFTYIVSHNLRTPVANAIGLANLLTSTDRTSASYDRSLSYLRLSLYRMDNVLKDMNTLLSIRDRQGNTGKERTDVKEVILQAMSALEEQFRETGVTLNVDVTDGLTVQANKAYLYSILFNLLSNAVKYRAEGRRLEVNILCRKEAGVGTTISFTDNGSGFDMEKNRNNVFKLYKRFHPHTEGRGMGLFLIKAHLDSMGGSIQVNSQVGNGTSFLISLPKN